MRQRLWGLLMIFGLMILIVGCSSTSSGKEVDGASSNNEEGQITEEADESEQIEVSLMIHWGEKEFENTFNQHIKKALPHIKLTYIQASGKEEIEESFAKGLIPDIAMGTDFGMFQELELLRDQMPLIEKHGLDLSKYDQGIIESLKANSPIGELDALPVFKQGYVMTYNKDIFDAFGVPYPTDNMTWDEVIELGKQLTGEKDGKKYYGIFPGKLGLQQVSTTLVDPETNEPTILDNKELRIFLERIQEIINIPGNLPEMESTEELAAFLHNAEGADTAFDYALFPFRDQANGLTWREYEAGLNFDWVTYPVWGGDYPDYAPNELLNTMFVTSQSEKPDAAFEVLAYLMSEDYQKWSVSTGGGTPLLDKEVYKEFGTALEHADIMAEKNVDALFKLDSAPIPKRSPYESASVMINAYQRLLEGEDLNTVIRKMDDETRNVIAEMSGKE
ncbi:hypothetical protein J14TS2_30530 [Bacillus sp. J14TS2]|nr:hypothetical protein J14TS2_30530 [Bacillus sp. J14TS2]